MFFLSLYQSQGGSAASLDDLQKGPPPLTIDEINNSINKATENLNPSQDGLLAQIAELQKQVNGLEQSAAPCCVDALAEQQKQIDALALQPQPQLGTMAALQQSNLPWVIWDTTAEGVPTDVGTMAWDGGTTIGVQMTANVLQKIGEDYFFYIKASSAITKGDLVMFTGAVGASGVVTGAPSTGVTNDQYIMGVAAESIALNGFGLVQVFGVLRGITTTGASVGETWADGDILYYNSAYTGGLTKVYPTSGPIVTVAAVVNAGSGGSGSIQIRPSVTQRLTAGTGISVSQTATGTTISSTSGGGAPVTKTANFSVADGETWLINNKSGSSCTVTLPAASSYTGRVLYFQNYQAQTLVSASSNVVPLVGGAAGTAILAAVAGETCTLVSDGTSWIMTQYTPNNVLLLE